MPQLRLRRGARTRPSTPRAINAIVNPLKPFEDGAGPVMPNKPGTVTALPHWAAGAGLTGVFVVDVRLQSAMRAGEQNGHRRLPIRG